MRISVTNLLFAILPIASVLANDNANTSLSPNCHDFAAVLGSAEIYSANNGKTVNEFDIYNLNVLFNTDESEIHLTGSLMFVSRNDISGLPGSSIPMNCDMTLTKNESLNWLVKDGTCIYKDKNYKMNSSDFNQGSSLTDLGDGLSLALDVFLQMTSDNFNGTMRLYSHIISICDK